MSRRMIVCLGAAALLSGSACSKSCGSDHPYVPYAIGSSVADAAGADGGRAGPSVDDGPKDAGLFAEEPAEVAPAGASTWTLGGLALVAPPGRVFALGLARDFDGDGATDAFAVVRVDGKPESPGELVYYRGAGDAASAPPAPVASPGDLLVDAAAVRADGAACAATQRLSQIGRRSVFAEIGIGCPRANTPARWIIAAVVDDGAPRVDLGATVLDPRGAPRLGIDLDASDYDGDGTDDLALRATLEGGGAPFEPGPKVSAVIRWLDKAAGLSRDPQATEASLAQLAAVATARATKAKEAAQVPAYVTQVRALYRAMCPEAGAPRIVRRTGSAAMACVASRSLEEASFAEVHAWATLDDPLRAIEALDRAQRPPATKTPARVTAAEGWITQDAPVALAREIRYVASVPRADKGTSPAWGSLAFEPKTSADGARAGEKLLVRTSSGVRRVDPDLGDEQDADGVASWPSAVTSPDGAMLWIEAYDPCDGFALRATLAPTGDGEMHDVVLPVPPPLGGRCAGRGERAHVVPIAWGPRGIEAIVAGEPVLVAPDFTRAHALSAMLDQPYTKGAPRSPNGKVLVVPTSQGLLVRPTGQKARLFRSPELDGTYAQQRGCAVNDDATRVACSRAGKAWVGTWDPP